MCCLKKRCKGTPFCPHSKIKMHKNDHFVRKQSDLCNKTKQNTLHEVRLITLWTSCRACSCCLPLPYGKKSGED